MCFVLLDTLDSFAERMVKILRIVIDLDTHRPSPKFWFPGRVAKLKETLDSNPGIPGATGPVSMGMGTLEDTTSFRNNSTVWGGSDITEGDEDYDQRWTGEFAESPCMAVSSSLLNTNLDVLVHVGPRNPDAFPPRTAVGRFFYKVGAFFRWFKTPEAIMAMRHAIVSVALWVPSVCHSSAWFYHDNKGIWALVMAQVCSVFLLTKPNPGTHWMSLSRWPWLCMLVIR